MIRDLTIQDFRLFHRFDIHSLARVNLIVGTNNSGKSSLLEAIHLLTSDDVRSSLTYILSERGEFVSGSIDPRSDRGRSGGYQVSQVFHDRTLAAGKKAVIQSFGDRDAMLRITLQDDRSQRREPDQPSMFADDDGLPEGRVEWMVFERNGRDGEGVRLRITEDGLLIDRPLNPRRVLHPKGISRFMTTNYMGFDELAALWDKITLTPKEEKVIESLRILEPAVERISFTSSQTSNSGILLKLRKEAGPVPLGSMGDGMRRILAVSASLVSVDNGTLLVDEIDTGLYHEVIADMWRLVIETADKQDAQVFATTHSWDCVKAFRSALVDSGNPQAGCLVRLERSGDRVKAVRYSVDDLDIAVQEGIEVR
jgi:energy-coupling factor transporter ATP-binding protein EcfA2